jgi:predicted nucleic acid-binding Zn ribbon protein
MTSKRCPDCGATVAGKKTFCDATCRERFHNRSSKRGRVLVPLAMAWRCKYGRTAGSRDSYSELWRLIDRFNAEDKAAGRPPMVDHTERLMTGPAVRWIDR